MSNHSAPAPMGLGGACRGPRRLAGSPWPTTPWPPTGVECRKDEGVIDETPGAYKDISQVMAAQADLVDIVAELRQVVVVKG